MQAPHDRRREPERKAPTDPVEAAFAEHRERRLKSDVPGHTSLVCPGCRRVVMRLPVSFDRIDCLGSWWQRRFRSLNGQLVETARRELVGKTAAFEVMLCDLTDPDPSTRVKLRCPNSKCPREWTLLAAKLRTMLSTASRAGLHQVVLP